MKKILLTIITICFCCTFAAAQEETTGQTEEKDFSNLVMTAAGFQAVQIEEKDFIFSPSANLQFMRMKNEGVESAQPDSIVIGAGYSQDIFTKGLGPDQVKNLHGINLMGNVSLGKNSFMLMVASGGEVPFSAITTVTGMAMYTRQLIQKDNLSLVVGGGIIVADLGLKIKDFELYVLPLPVINFGYSNNIFAASLSFMGMPSVQLTLLPESMFRLRTSCQLEGFESARDIGFDCALVYYPLYFKDANELLSISGGVMTNGASAKLKNKDSYDFKYYTAYGEINATLISLRCGYNFDGKTYLNKKETGDMYKGLFASIQGMFMF